MIPYRKSFEVVGFTFHASMYCHDCGINLPEVDPEGNQKHPVFLDNLNEEMDSCDACQTPATEWRQP